MHADCYPPGQNGQSGTLSQHVAGRQTGTVSLTCPVCPKCPTETPLRFLMKLHMHRPPGQTKQTGVWTFRPRPGGVGKCFLPASAPSPPRPSLSLIVQNFGAAE